MRDIGAFSGIIFGSVDLKICPNCHLLTEIYQDKSLLQNAYESYYTHQKSPETKVVNLGRAGISYFIKSSFWRAKYGHAGASPIQKLIAWTVGFTPILGERLGGRIDFLYSRYGSSLLDVGCGNGEFAHRLKTLGWDVYGLEPDKFSYELTKDVLGDHAFDSSLDLFHPNLKFDVVTMNHVVEHFEDPFKAIGNISGLLKPGGLLYIATPNSRSLGFKIFGNEWDGLSPGYHYFVFSVESLSRLLEKEGFSVIYARASSKSGYDIFKEGFKQRSRWLRFFLAPLLAVMEWILSKFTQVGEEVVVLAKKNS